jgi:hypothetical protein
MTPERIAELEALNAQLYRDLAGLNQIWRDLCDTLTNISGKNAQSIPIWNLPSENTPSERAMNYIVQLAAENARLRAALNVVISDWEYVTVKGAACEGCPDPEYIKACKAALEGKG